MTISINTGVGGLSLPTITCSDYDIIENKIVTSGSLQGYVGAFVIRSDMTFYINWSNYGRAVNAVALY